MANNGDTKSGNKLEFEAPNLSRIATAPSPHHRHGGLSNNETPKRASRQSLGSDRSIDHSPLHSHNQPSKVVSGKGGVVTASLSWEKKSSSEGNHGLAPSTPGRSRLSSIPRGNDTPDDSPAVPKFGDWDENDPNATEGFTQIFQLVRDEKQNGTGKVPNSASEGSYHNGHKQYGKKSDKTCGCFPWGGK